MKIKAKMVDEDKRLAFLPKYFGMEYMKAENYIYDVLSGMCKDYTGGYWHFFELSNGGFYMAPNFQKMRLIVPTNGYEGEMSGDAAGIVTSIVVINDLCWNYNGKDELLSQLMGDYYYKLKDFACEHEEHRAILGAID